MTSDDGWGWFQPPAEAPVTAELAADLAACFATPAGKRVWRALLAMTVERALGPEAGDTALRHLEGQRQLVLSLRAMMARAS